MARLRIVCRSPKPVLPPPGSKYPVINGLLPSLEDCELYVIKDDGTEEPLGGAIAVKWEAKRNHVATVTLECCDVDVDLEGVIVENVRGEGGARCQA